MRASAATTSRVQLDSPRLTMSATALSMICSRRFSGDMRCARFLTGMALRSPHVTFEPKRPFYASLRAYSFCRLRIDDEHSFNSTSALSRRGRRQAHSSSLRALALTYNWRKPIDLWTRPLKYKIGSLAIFGLLAGAACGRADSADFGPSNPFYAASTLPFGAPPFDKIKDGDYQPAIERAIREAVASGVPLLGVISNAGIALGGPLERLPIDELRRQFDVNVFGALAVVQAALPHLPAPGGRVVFVGSISGRLAMPYLGPYSASKFALRALADALRVELAPDGIAVALIEPGSVKTPIWRKGRESRDRIAATLGTDARPHYYRALERILKMTESEERGGIPAERVAEAILHALTARRPRENYLIGSAKAGSVVAMLPSKIRNRILRASQRL